MPATALALGQLDDDDREVIAALDASYTKGSRKSAAPNPEAQYMAARQRQSGGTRPPMARTQPSQRRAPRASAPCRVRHAR